MVKYQISLNKFVNSFRLIRLNFRLENEFRHVDAPILGFGSSLKKCGDKRIPTLIHFYDELYLFSASPKQIFSRIFFMMVLRREGRVYMTFFSEKRNVGTEPLIWASEYI